jgi:hypothetical protein
MRCQEFRNKNLVRVCFEFSYINLETYIELIKIIDEIGRLINYMINNPDKFGSK